MEEVNSGYPTTYDAAYVEGASAQANVFEPALKQYSRAFRLGDPAFKDPEVAESWYAARRLVIGHLLRIVSTSPWESHLVLRGSLLLKVWLGEAAREPGDIDWVVTPQGISMASRQAEELITGLIQRIAEQPLAGSARIDAASITRDEIWTYERAPGQRLVLPWSAPGIPDGSVQMDLVFGEPLWTDPVVTPLSLTEGQSSSVWAVDRPLALAWKLLWLESDMYPQGKDMYDATLLAEQTVLPLELLRQVFDTDDCLRKQAIRPDFPVRWHVDWENFQQEYPWVTGSAREWQERLSRALAPTFTALP